MYKSWLKYLNIFLLVVFAATSSANAKEAGEEFFKAMLAPMERDFSPYTAEMFEDAKLNALQEKDADAMYTIGMMYLEAINTNQDFVQAREWFQKSSNLGNSNAMAALAHIYTLEKRITKFDKSFTRAENLIFEAVKAENPKAYYQMGLWYERGIVFQKDYEKALEYYQKAADANIINAYVKLAEFYYLGKGTPVNLKEALKSLIKIRNESKNAQVKNLTRSILGETYMRLALIATDPEIKFKLYELAWSHGMKKAADAIGDMYSEGVGVRKNYLIAEQWYQKAVDTFESIYSMEKLGLLYLKGPGDIERDYNKAFKMFNRASELGGVSGAHFLGYMYYYGLGVEKDVQMANMWFDRSKKNAERVRKMGTLDNIDYETNVDNLLKR